MISPAIPPLALTPWATVPVGDFFTHCTVADSAMHSILTIVEEDGVKFAAFYDLDHAKLCAAAPDLLQALDILRDCLESSIELLGHDPADDARVKLARAAIAKATGAQQ